VNFIFSSCQLLGVFVTLAMLPGGHAAPLHYKLIAHRGGVVENKNPDNSEAALHAAVARGYWGLEVDIRETKDGVLVMQHDPDLKQNFGDPRAIHQITWEEMRGLRTTRGNQAPWRFEDLVKAAHQEGLRLMLDSKDPHSPGFVEKVEAVLRKYDMLDRCYIIGTADALSHFPGRALVGLKYKSLRPRLEADPSLRNEYFLFDEGTTLTAEMVRWAQERGVKVVPSINGYHYFDPNTMHGKSREELAKLILPLARRHIEALKALGVTEFQIDSEFDGWFDLPAQ
jgi:hypothetical protein